MQDDACMCTVETWKGTRERDPKCKKGFKLGDDCQCNVKEKNLCRKIKCPMN